MSLDQEGAEGVKTLRLTILPDSGSAGPVSGGNPNCGVAIPEPSANKGAAGTTGGKVQVQVRFLEKARVRGSNLKVGGVSCPSACGAVRAVVKQGHRVIARAKFRSKAAAHPLRLRLTGTGRKLLAHAGRLKARVQVWVTPPGATTTHARHAVLLIRKR